MFLPEPCSPGRGQYYTELGREGYYLEGGEPRGEWCGQGADQLRLQGKIQKEHFKNLFRGLAPKSGEPLVELQRKKGKATHRPGVDGVFRPPKSVSVAWALVADTRVRHGIQKAHDDAVRDAVSYFEKNFAYARRGRGGRQLESAGLCVGLFQHGTSRADDCDLHTHAVFLNVVYRPSDNSWGTLKTEPLYEQQKLLGAIYRASLANRLAREGWELEVAAHGFRLKAVSPDLEELFSKRSQEMDKELRARRARGEAHDGHAVRDEVAKATRKAKSHLPRAEFFQRWRTEAGRLLTAPKIRPSLTGEFTPIARQAFGKLLKERTWFARSDITHALALAAQTGEAGLSEIEHAAASLAAGKAVRRLGQDQRGEYFAGEETLSQEHRVFSEAQRLSERTRDVQEKYLERALRAHPELNEEQVRAVCSLTKGPDIACLEGYAGTGKTYTLSAVRDAFERAGYNVVGAATANKAAGELMRGARIKNSRSIASCLWHLEPSTWQRLRGVYYGVKYGPVKPAVHLNKKTVLVIDEASMVGTQELCKLLSHARRAGSKVILAGDSEQLPAIRAAAPFRKLAKALGAARLRTIIRQSEKWERNAIRELAEGDVENYYKEAAAKGRVNVSIDLDEARQELLQDWRTTRTEDLKNTLVLTATNREREGLNADMQAVRLDDGEVSAYRAVRRGDKTFRVGDRIVCNKNNRPEGYFNGDLGAIQSFQLGLQGVCAIVRLDREETKPGLWRRAPSAVRVKVPLKEIDLGYALTTHRAQGTTVERAFVLGGRALLSRALAYVQVSRAKEFTKLYFGEADAGRELRTLVARTEKGRLEQGLATQKQQELEQGLRLSR